MSCEVGGFVEKRHQLGSWALLCPSLGCCRASQTQLELGESRTGQPPPPLTEATPAAPAARTWPPSPRAVTYWCDAGFFTVSC